MAGQQQGPMRRFERMSQLKHYKVEKGLSDPRGWKVIDPGGHVAGQVTDLIVDTDRMKAAYLEVELDRKTFALRDDPRVLVPMARAEQDGSSRRLRVPALTRSRITSLYEARAEHEAGFWEHWWQQDDAGAGDESTVTRERIVSDPDRGLPESDLGRAIGALRPGEEIRVPVGGERVVVERRPLEAEDVARRSATANERRPGSRIDE